MRKLPILIFIFFYCTGTLISPSGSIFSTKNITEVYNKCGLEDPDINVADFIFEHMLNLGNVFGEFDNEPENEKPHQPYQHVHQIAQIFVVVSKLMYWDTVAAAHYTAPRKAYPVYSYHFVPSAFLTEVFHPPSLSFA